MGSYLSFLLYAATAWVVQRLPLSAVRALARVLGDFFHTFIPIRRALTREQLRLAFPERSEREIRELARKSYRSLATALLEMMWVPRLTPEILEREMRIEDPSVIDRIRERGQGALLMTGHYANWEWVLHRWNLAFEHPLMVIVHPLHNPRVDRLVESWRSLRGNSVVPMRHAARAAYSTLREKGYVSLIADQSAAKESVFIPFFGRPAATFEGPARFALRENVPVLLMLPVRQSDGSYVLRGGEIPFDDLVGGDTEENREELTRRHTAALEARIREHPEFWLWQHKRWKHSPPTSVVVSAE